jgi:hypothetical protein
MDGYAAIYCQARSKLYRTPKVIRHTEDTSMNHNQQQALQAVSNIFNTHASAGTKSLDKEDIRARLMTDLFFVDSLLIPGTSLLCNPISHFMLYNDQDFFAKLLISNKIAPIFTTEAKSFSILLEQLIANKSAAVNNKKPRELQEVANFLDKYHNDSDQITIDQDELNNAKTKTCKDIINMLEYIIPEAKPYQRYILDLFHKELNKSGFVTGGWWTKLTKNRQLKDLQIYDDRLGEIGSMVFDFPYAQIIKNPLIGHAYHQNISNIGGAAKPFLPKIELETKPEIFEIRDIDGIFFDKRILSKMDLGIFEILNKNTEIRRLAYRKGMMNLISNPSEDLLLEAKNRLDEYLISLSEVTRSSTLLNFADQSRKIKKIQSYIKILRYTDDVVLTLVAGSPAVAGALLPQHAHQFSIIAVAATIASKMLKTTLSKKMLEFEGKLEKETRLREQLRPTTIQLNPKP